jgi:LuxR family transcriptional regulator of spore coat protein
MVQETPWAVLLSARECQILALCADGLSDAQIGAELGISPKTVNFHIENIKRRLNARNRVHAVAMAMRRRLID